MPSLLFRFERLLEHARGHRPRAVLIILTVTLFVAAAGCIGGPRRLPHDPASLPYAFRHAAADSYTPMALYVADFDGDGVDEQVRFVCGNDNTSYWDIDELNEFKGDRNLHTGRVPDHGTVSGVVDVTGDGVPEVVWYEQDEGSCTAFLHVTQVDLGESAEVRELALVTLQYDDSARRASDWYTTAVLLHAFDLDGNGTLESLACAMNTGVARSPRGIWLVDWETRRVVWRRDTAGTATGGHAALDINGDGAPEIVTGLEAPGNGVTAGEWRDDVAYLAVIRLDGSVAWWRELAGYSSTIALAAGDLDGDGDIEVVTGVREQPAGGPDRPSVAVWRGRDGVRLAALPLETDAVDVAILDCPEGPRLVVAGSDGVVRRARYDGRDLVVELETDCGEKVEHLGLAPLGPAVSGPGVVVSLASGSVAALDLRLMPLALLQGDDGPTHPICGALHAARFRVEGGVVEGVHVLTLRDHRRLYVARNPLPFPLRVGLCAAAVLAVLAVVPALRRGSIALLRRLVLPRATREGALDDLLGALATASHGKLTATSTFRRLREQASMLTLYEGTPPPEFGARFREAMENGRDVGLPRVREILARAVRLGLVPAASARLSRELRDLDRVTSRPTDAVPSPAEAVALRDRLDRVLPAVTAELEAVKRAADLERSTPLSKGIERAAAAGRDDLAAAGVTLTLPTLPDDRGPRVAGTAAEVVFIIENLLGNAARALAGRSDPVVSVALSLGPGIAVVTVEDNGKGIPEDRHAAVFEEGVSDRAGGGHGLPESRRILALRGGSIRIARSVPGEGTAFEVRFRVVS